MNGIVLDAGQTQSLLTWVEVAGVRRGLVHRAKQTERLEELRSLAAEHGRLAAECDALESRQSGHEEAAATCERDADALRERIARTEQKLNDGTGLTSRDLLGLQEEIAGHRSRVEEIENRQVEALEAAETASEALAGKRAEKDQVASRGRDLQAERAAEGQRFTAEIVDADARLSAAATPLPAGVRSRLTTEGEYPAAATVQSGACGACGAQLSGAAADTYRHAASGTCLECEDCGALLVRAGD